MRKKINFKNESKKKFKFIKLKKLSYIFLKFI